MRGTSNEYPQHTFSSQSKIFHVPVSNNMIKTGYICILDIKDR